MPKSLRLEQPLTLRQEHLARATILLGSALLLRGANLLRSVVIPSWSPPEWFGVALRVGGPVLLLAGAVVWNRTSERQLERWLAALATSSGGAFLACIVAALRLGPTCLIIATYAESAATFCTLALLGVVARGSNRSFAAVLMLCFLAAWVSVWANDELLLFGLRAEDLAWPLGVIAVAVMSAGGLWLVMRAALVPQRQLEFRAPGPDGLRARVLTFRDNHVHLAVSGRGEVRYADLADALSSLDADGFVEAEQSGADEAQSAISEKATR